MNINFSFRTFSSVEQPTAVADAFEKYLDFMLIPTLQRFFFSSALNDVRKNFMRHYRRPVVFETFELIRDMTKITFSKMFSSLVRLQCLCRNKKFSNTNLSKQMKQTCRAISKGISSHKSFLASVVKLPCIRLNVMRKCWNVKQWDLTRKRFFLTNIDFRFLVSPPKFEWIMEKQLIPKHQQISFFNALRHDDNGPRSQLSTAKTLFWSFFCVLFSDPTNTSLSFLCFIACSHLKNDLQRTRVNCGSEKLWFLLEKFLFATAKLTNHMHNPRNDV